ncbi:MAG: nitroreductase family protein [Gallionella sp.]|nr:nitroreductase family protein [Gallionella sp.]
MTHPIIQDLQWRYTTKKFDQTKKVPQADLDVLFEAMRLSPSSINSQPWRFIVLGTADAKERMNRTFANKYQFNQPHVVDSSHIILFAHNPHYTRANYGEVIDCAIADGRTQPEARDSAFGAFIFAELNTDKTGDTSVWTKAQTYLALGNALHVLARLKIDSTTMEGIDAELVNQEFEQELDGYHCQVALAIGYHQPQEDHNAKLPKSRRKLESILVQL